jgi:hypothetical protein
MKRVGGAGVVLAVMFLTIMGSAWGASTIYLCLAEKAGPAKSGGVEGKCPNPTAKVTYAKVALPEEEAAQQTLLAILSHVQYSESGVGGKPTIQFSGVNVQIVNGEGKTASVNGDGNLVIGYDENPGKHEQTGSHSLILGEGQTFTSFAGLLAGIDNTISAPFASVSGGVDGRAQGYSSSVGGGFFNTASAEYASVSGGERNTASGPYSSVSGGYRNTAGGFYSSIAGGQVNAAATEAASVSGGSENTAFGLHAAWIGGGGNNMVSNSYASVFGGHKLTASLEYEAIP